MKKNKNKKINVHDLREACQQGNIKKVESILATEDVSSFINTCAGVFGYTPLHEATSSRNYKLVELLLKHGSNVDARSFGSYTPLHVAASIGDVQCTEVLLKHKADVKSLDEYGKTPHRTAVINRRRKVAKILKTAEVKRAVKLGSGELGKMIESLQCGVDVTDDCFEQCLQLAVESNNHFSAGFIILRLPSNMTQCFQLAMGNGERKNAKYKVAAMILLCLLAYCGDTEVLTILCRPDYKHQQVPGSYESLLQKYLPSKILYPEVLLDLRKGIKEIDHAFPVSLACNQHQYNATKVLLFNLYCSEHKLEADWHGLAITSLKSDWIDDIAIYKKLFLGWNSLTKLPSNIQKLTCLVRLDLQHNSLYSLPASLFQLPMLRSLRLSDNKLEELPVVDRWTSSLNVLDLERNFLHAFPAEVEGATMDHINLSYNQFVTVPLGICKITSLTYLDISYNKDIHELPAQLGNLTKLTHLSLKGLQITDPPGHQKETIHLIRYLRAKLRSAEPYYVMKLLLIGKANHGKSTLMRRLMGDDNFNDNFSTQGIDIQDIEIKKKGFYAIPFKFRVWDFAGQEEYYATHQCFLSARSLYLLIWDVNDGERGVEALRPWLDNIAMRVPNSTVIIVGTKLDQVVGSIEHHQEKMKAKLSELILSRSIYRKLNTGEDYFVFVSKLKEHKPRIEALKQLIYNVAEKITYDGKENSVRVMGEKIPLSYKYLEHELDELQKKKQQEKTIPVITKEEFVAIAYNINCPRDKLTIDDIDPVTVFLHNIGTILHYNDPNQGLKDLYFISPSWLCKLMAKIITVKEVNSFFREGILETEKIQLIIGKTNKEFPMHFYDKYMRLLYRFQIACKVDDHRILVPSKLPERNHTASKMLEVDDRDLLTRYHFFTCIPFGFWSRFMSRILLLMSEMLSTYEEPRIQDDIVEVKAEIVSVASVDGNAENAATNDDDRNQVHEDNLSVSSATLSEFTSCGKDDGVACYETHSGAPRINTESNYSNGLVYVNNMLEDDDKGNKMFGPQNGRLGAFTSNDSSQTYNSNTSVVTSASDISDFSDRYPMIESSSSQSPCFDSDRGNFSSLESESLIPGSLKSKTDHSVASGLEKLKLSNEQTSVNCIESSVNDGVSELSRTSSSSEGESDSNNVVDKEEDVLAVGESHSHMLVDEKDEIVRESVAPSFKDSFPPASSVVYSTSTTLSTVGEVTEAILQDADRVTALDDEERNEAFQENFEEDQEPLIQQCPTSKYERMSSCSKFRTSKKYNRALTSASSTDAEDVSFSAHASFNDSVASITSRDKNISSKRNKERFNDRTDLAYLLDKKYLRCWKDGLLFNHPELVFSVKQVPSIMVNRQAIETKVSNNALGYRVLGFMAEHIRTLVKEWYPGFSGDDGEHPYILQRFICPVCKKMGKREPHQFDIRTAFEEIFRSECTSEYSLPCPENHVPKVINIEELCPELMFKDLPRSLQINESDLHYEANKDDSLGSGAFGEVYRGRFKTTPVAVKVYKFDDSTMVSGLEAFYEIRQEIFILSKLRNHPYIVQYLGFTIKPRLCAVMELAESGTLETALKSPNININRIVFYRIVQQLASGLTFMHSRNIIHRDIKPDNILLFSLRHDAEVNVKLTDFGTANFVASGGMKWVIGTVGFMAPEMFDYCSQDEYSVKIDIYSLGMVLYELITKRRPFNDLQSAAEISEALKSGARPMYCDILQSFYGMVTLTEMMIKLWHQEPMHRPNAEQVLQQSSSVAFQLLYGKQALEAPQNPRYMCYVEKTEEIWVVCDDMKGSFLSVLDMKTSNVKETLTINGMNYGLETFNLVHICVIAESHVVLVIRGSHDVLLTFSVDQDRKIERYHSLDEFHVTALTTNESYVFLGYQHGVLARVPKRNFVKGKFHKNVVEIKINESRPISSIVVSKNYIILANDKYLYKYPCHFTADQNYTHMLKSHKCQLVREISLSEDEAKIFVSFQCSPEVIVYDVDTFESCEISCQDIIEKLSPHADSNDTRVTCLCQARDVLWVGTGSGHVLIYHFYCDINKLSYLTSFQPYSMEMRRFLLIKSPNFAKSDCGIDGVVHDIEGANKYLMLTTGKQLNENGFGKDSLCKLNGYFPNDKAYFDRAGAIGNKERESPFGFSMKENQELERKVILFWEVLSSDGIKTLQI